MAPRPSSRPRHVTGRRWLLLAGAALAVAAAMVAFGGDRRAGITSIDRALKDLESQVRARPQDVSARLAIAAAYAQRGRLDDAVAQYEQALVLEADNQTALIGIGRVHLDAGRFEDAFTPLQRVAELNADNPMRYAIEELEAVYYDLARIHVHRGEFEEARGRLVEAVEINRTDADALRLMGNVLAEIGDLEGAAEALTTAIRLVPDYVEAYEDLARVFTSVGRDGGRLFAEGMIALVSNSPEASIGILERAVAAEPDLADAHQGLGMAYESAGQLSAALASYERAADLNPALFLSVSGVARLQPQVDGTARATKE